MKPIILVVAILLAGGSAYWGYSNHNALEEAGLKNQEIKDTTDTRVAVQKKTELDRQDMEKHRDLAIEEKAQVSASLETATNDNVKYSSEITTIKAELASLEKSLTEKLGATDDRDPDALLAEVEGLKTSIEEKQNRLKELETLTEAAVKKCAPFEADLKKLEDRIAKYNSDVTRNGIEYTVTAIDPKWGFVIFNAGEKAELDSTVPMIVFRNGQRQALLRITQVEKNQTIADIVPSSVKPGNTIQVGDKVISLRPQG